MTASAKTILLISIPLLLYVYTRGFIPHDEGWILHPAQRITQGELPYRDFRYIYTPAVAYFIALAFKLFGVSVLVSRLATLTIALASVWLILSIGKKIDAPARSQFLAVATYLVWGPMHLNFAWPAIFVIAASLLTLRLLLGSQQKPKTWIFLTSGVTTGLTLLLKQNLGLALVAANLVYFLTPKNKSGFAWHIAGFLLFLSAFIAHLALTRSLQPFISDMHFFFIQNFSHQATPFIYPGAWYRQALKTAFYLSPAIVSILAMIFTVRSRPNLKFLALFPFFFYLSGIRPTTDYLHLVPLLSASSLSWLLLPRPAHTLAIVLVSLGLYRSLFSNYYRWNPPLITQSFPVSNRRLGISVDHISQSLLTKLQNSIAHQTPPGSPMFVYSFSPSFYILTGTTNPTRFIFSPPNLLSPADQSEIVSSLEAANVKTILTDRPLDNSTPILTNFISSRFYQGKPLREYTVWKKITDAPTQSSPPKSAGQ